MFSQASGHRWCSVLPFRLDQTFRRLTLRCQGQSEAHMRSGEVVKGMEEADSPSHLVPVFAEAQGFARERSQCLAHGEVKPLNQVGTDGKTKFFESLSTTKDALRQGLESAALLLFDNLCVDQVRMGLYDRVSGATSLSCLCERIGLMVDSHQCGEVGAESVA